MSDRADAQAMRQAIRLAETVMGQTWPNPAVGCVIVKDGRVLAQAATGPGGPQSSGHRRHAEELALEAAGAQAAGARVYVTLEPCAVRSSGRPSCAERLAQARPAVVFVACEDPSALACGKGLERLREAGIALETGLLADEAEALYRGYKHRLVSGLPRVEAADDAAGFDAAFEPAADQPLEQALRALGEAGYTRLWVARAGPLAHALRAAGLLAD